MSTVSVDWDDEFLAAACRAMASTSGPGSLRALGWWDLLPELADPQARAAVFAVFRAQGRELADTSALAAILALPYLDRIGAAPGTVVAATRRRSLRRGDVWVVAGDVDSQQLLFDEPGRGVVVIDPATVERHGVDIPGRVLVHEVSVDLTAHRCRLDDDDARPARARSAYLGRLAVATEILGTAERAVELAVGHAGDRQQFGRPIGTFQAVRHILAWARTDCAALDGVVRTALTMLEDPPARYDEVVKAIAGRNGRRACERALQVLGGIGFTAEHAHHHHHSRVLLLDALLGSSAELSHDLGAWLRTSGDDPGFAAAVLATTPG